MQTSNYIVVEDWMLTKLGLVGNKVLVFAIIYGFSKDNAGAFYGGRKYLANRLGMSIRTVERVLADLVEQGLIIRKEGNTTKGETNAYIVNTKLIQEKLSDSNEQDNHEVKNEFKPSDNSSLPELSPGDKMSLPLSSNCRYPSDKMSPNNKYILNNNNKYNNSTTTNKSSSSTSVPGQVQDKDEDDFVKIADIFAEKIKNSVIIPPNDLAILRKIVRTYGKDLVLSAIDKAQSSGGRSAKYVQSILEGWHKNRFKPEAIAQESNSNDINPETGKNFIYAVGPVWGNRSMEERILYERAMAY